jgi:hypothetical protein
MDEDEEEQPAMKAVEVQVRPASRPAASRLPISSFDLGSLPL